MTSSPSPIEDLIAAIQSHNPFDKPAIVKSQDVWGKGFPDVETLNSHASDAVFEAIKRVRTSQSTQDKVTSLAITAEKGVGKSHIISRIRHRLEREGGALFVYASADIYVDLDLIKYQFQQTLADSLKHTGSQGVMQWQEVATAMANEASQASKSNASTLAPEQLVKRFDQVYDQKIAEKKKDLMEVLVEKVLKNKPNSDPDIVRAILWTLSEKRAPYAINWLSGKELFQKKADQLGLPSNYNKTNQDREAEALNTVRQILNLVTDYYPVLICFDEMDVIDDCDAAGNRTPEVIADFVKKLFDTQNQSESSQGVVILTVMMPDTWTHTIKQLSGGIPDRVAANGKPIALNYMDGDSIIELVKYRLKDFYEERNLKSIHPVYPFEENQLRELGKEKLPVRNILRWCAENFKVDVPQLPEDPLERFDFAIERESEVELSNYLEDNSLIADVIFFGFHTLKEQIIEGVTIKDVTKGFGKNGGKDKYVNFKIIGNENGKAIKIGVAVLQDSNGMAFQARLKRLMEYKALDITRGCLVRSQNKKVNRSWKKAWKYLNQLTSELGGEFVELIEEQLKPLFAIYFVYQKRDKYSLSEEQVLAFISQKPITIDNLLLQEILSDPSGQLPEIEEDIFDELAGKTSDNAAEYETSIYDEFTSLSSTDSTTDEDDMSDLFN